MGVVSRRPAAELLSLLPSVSAPSGMWPAGCLQLTPGWCSRSRSGGKVGGRAAGGVRRPGGSPSGPGGTAGPLLHAVARLLWPAQVGDVRCFFCPHCRPAPSTHQTSCAQMGVRRGVPDLPLAPWAPPVGTREQGERGAPARETAESQRDCRIADNTMSAGDGRWDRGRRGLLVGVRARQSTRDLHRLITSPLPPPPPPLHRCQSRLAPSSARPRRRTPPRCCHQR